MWLINTKTLELEEQPLLPNKYAILSHTWERTGEVTFRDMQDLSRASEKAGFEKIQKTCEIARAAGLEWAWVDTCCIDKSSSAELTESINSMLEWYREARICYAYLSDLQPRKHNPEAIVEELKACRWFTRGWTLQELVASRSVNFFDQDWNARGMKDDLKTALHEITGIDMDVLDDPGALHRIPIARRMSWAARRSTTRVEDRAYSLFGIFDVNLPLIYGEGHKAFLRLQEAILQNSTDLSLFAWEPAEDDEQAFRGLFAKSPSDFADGGAMVPMSDAAIQQTEIRLSNKGIIFIPDVMVLARRDLERMRSKEVEEPESSWGSTPARLVDWRSRGLLPASLERPDQKTYVMNLNLYYVSETKSEDFYPGQHYYTYVCIELFRTPNVFLRRKRWVLIGNLYITPRLHDKREIHAPRYLSRQQSVAAIQDSNHRFVITCNSSLACTFQVTSGYPGHLCYPETSIVCTRGQSGFIGMVNIQVIPVTDDVRLPEFAVFFGLGKPGEVRDLLTHYSPPWVYIPTQADYFLGRSRDTGKYSHSVSHDPEGLRHLIRRSLSPESYQGEGYTSATGRIAPIMSDCENSSGPYLLRGEFEGEAKEVSTLRVSSPLVWKLSSGRIGARTVYSNMIFRSSCGRTPPWTPLTGLRDILAVGRGQSYFTSFNIIYRNLWKWLVFNVHATFRPP